MRNSLLDFSLSGPDLSWRAVPPLRGWGLQRSSVSKCVWDILQCALSSSKWRVAAGKMDEMVCNGKTEDAVKMHHPHQKTLKQCDMFSWQFYVSKWVSVTINGHVGNLRPNRLECWWIDIVGVELWTSFKKVEFWNHNSVTTLTLVTAPVFFFFLSDCSSGKFTGG